VTIHHDKGAIERFITSGKQAKQNDGKFKKNKKNEKSQANKLF